MAAQNPTPGQLQPPSTLDLVAFDESKHFEWPEWNPSTDMKCPFCGTAQLTFSDQSQLPEAKVQCDHSSCRAAFTIRFTLAFGPPPGLSVNQAVVQQWWRKSWDFFLRLPPLTESPPGLIPFTKIPRSRAKSTFDQHFQAKYQADFEDVERFNSRDEIWAKFSQKWHTDNFFPDPHLFVQTYFEDRDATVWVRQYNEPEAVERRAREQRLNEAGVRAGRGRRSFGGRAPPHGVRIENDVATYQTRTWTAGPFSGQQGGHHTAPVRGSAERGGSGRGVGRGSGRGSAHGSRGGSPRGGPAGGA